MVLGKLYDEVSSFLTEEEFESVYKHLYFFVYILQKKYNNEYWSLNGYKYLAMKSKDNEHKLNHRE
jgi:hypothetical protein